VSVKITGYGASPNVKHTRPIRIDRLLDLRPKFELGNQKRAE